jgi:hypothetical protein
MKDKKTALKAYADYLQQRLKQPIPPKHQKSPQEYLQMLQIDLNKTLLKIEELSK